MEEFAQDLKFYCPNIFKETKNFINKRSTPPFSGEVVFFSYFYHINMRNLLFRFMNSLIKWSRSYARINNFA